MAEDFVLAEIIQRLEAAYTETDLGRIAAALGMIPCDPSATLILEIVATLHASCARGWRGDPLVYPPWVTRETPCITEAVHG